MIQKCPPLSTSLPMPWDSISYRGRSIQNGRLTFGHLWAKFPDASDQKDRPIILYIRQTDFRGSSEDGYLPFQDIEVDPESIGLATPYYYYPLIDGKRSIIPFAIYTNSTLMAFSKQTNKASFTFKVCCGEFADERNQIMFGFYGAVEQDPHHHSKNRIRSLSELCDQYEFIELDLF